MNDSNVILPTSPRVADTHSGEHRQSMNMAGCHAEGSVVYSRCEISSSGLMLEPKRLIDAWFCSSWL